MLFIYLYHDDLYSDLCNSDLYFRPADYPCIVFFFKSLVLTQPPRRRPLGFVCHTFISPPGTSAKHSRHLRSPITDRLPIFVKRNPNRFLRFARSVRLLIGCARNLCF